MKKTKLLFLILMPFCVNGMDWLKETFDKVDKSQLLRDFGNGVKDAAKGAAEAFEETARAWIDKDKREIEDLEKKIQWEPRNALRNDWQKRIDEIRKKIANHEEEILNMHKKGTETFFNGINMTMNAAAKQQDAYNDLQKAASIASINAESNKETAIENRKKELEASLEKFKYGLSADVLKKVGTLSAALIVTYFVAKYGVPKLIDYISGKPTLAQETSLLTLNEKIQMWLYNSAPKRSMDDVIFEPVIASQVNQISDSVKTTVENNDFFSHMLLYGPPGTGKTLVAKTIASTSGLEYIYFAASSLEQFSEDEALSKLTQLFDFAKNSKKKLMIVIDEAEILFANRANKMSDKTRKLLTHILTYTGTETRDFMMVLLTNRPQDLDEAVLSRCDHKIEISAPGYEQRKGIVKLYLDKIVVKASIIKPEPKKLEKAKNYVLNIKDSKPIFITPGLINDSLIEEITNKTDGFVGRDISKLMISILATVRTSKARILTREIIDTVLKQKVEQKHKESSGFLNISKRS